MNENKELSKFKVAQKRNYFKYVLSGMCKPIDTQVLTKEELEKWNTILQLRNELIGSFEHNSQSEGLKVPTKCWCGKPAKYVPEYINEEWYKNDGKNSGLVCKEHIKM